MKLFCILHLLLFLSANFIFRGISKFTLSPYPLPQRSIHHNYISDAVGIYNHILTIIQNDWYSADSYQDSTSLNPYNGSWKQETVDSPLGIWYFYAGHGSVQINNLIYIINPQIGGGNAINAKEMFIFDLISNVFSVSTKQPLIQGFGGCAVYNSNNNIIYYIGGVWSGVSIPNTQSYDVTNDIWSEKTPLNKARVWAGCAMDITQSSIYIFGGSDSNGKLNDIERYTVNSDKWDMLTHTLSDARNFLLCRLFLNDEHIYCMGGQNTLLVRVNTVDVFDTKTEAFIKTVYMHYRRTRFQATEYGTNCIYITGGYGGLSSETSDNNLNAIEYLGNCDNVCDPITCDDGNYCNGKETCSIDGICVEGTEIECGFGFNCDSMQGKCVRDCGSFDIDGYLQCSVSFLLINAELQAIDDDITSLDTRITGNNNDISTVNDAVSTLRQELKVSNGRIDGHDIDISSLNDDIMDLYQLMNETNDKIEQFGIVNIANNGIEANTANLFQVSLKDMFIIGLLLINMMMMFYLCFYQNSDHQYSKVQIFSDCGDS